MASQTNLSPEESKDQEEIVFICYSCKSKLVVQNGTGCDQAICPVCNTELIVPILSDQEKPLDINGAILLMSTQIVYSGHLDVVRFHTKEDNIAILNNIQKEFMTKYARTLDMKKSATIHEMETNSFFLVHITKHINPENLRDMQDFLKRLTKPYLAKQSQ